MTNLYAYLLLYGRKCCFLKPVTPMVDNIWQFLPLCNTININANTNA